MEENKQIERKVIRISRKKIIITVVVLFLILVVGWVLLGGALSGARIMSTGGGTAMPLGSSKGIENSIMPYRDIYQEGNSSITDTREFMKTSYNASIQTRDVSKVVTDIKNIVKGADGRVDNINSSEKYGYVSFVVAKSKFDAFKDEIETLTHKKLYTESISSQNLLTEKQGIEGQIIDANSSLESLISKRTELGNTHTKTINNINKELSRISNELVAVRTSISTEKDSQILVALRNQESSFVSQQTYQKQKLSEENKNYSIQKSDLDNWISNANANLNNANKQDDKFMDNIETVEGYVRVNWISIWGLAVIFSPIHPTWIIIILIIASFIIFRKRMPKVEIV